MLGHEQAFGAGEQAGDIQPGNVVGNKQNRGGMHLALAEYAHADATHQDPHPPAHQARPGATQGVGVQATERHQPEQTQQRAIDQVCADPERAPEAAKEARHHRDIT